MTEKIIALVDYENIGTLEMSVCPVMNALFYLPGLSRSLYVFQL